MLKYIPITGKPENVNANFLRVELFYHIGGAYGSTKARGYYITVVPVERSEKYGCIMESFGAYSGITVRILPVTRKSAKAERDAENIAPDWEKKLIDYVCEKHGLSVNVTEVIKK